MHAPPCVDQQAGLWQSCSAKLGESFFPDINWISRVSLTVGVDVDEKCVECIKAGECSRPTKLIGREIDIRRSLEISDDLTRHIRLQAKPLWLVCPPTSHHEKRILLCRADCLKMVERSLKLALNAKFVIY